MGQRCRRFGCFILIAVEVFDLITDWFFYIDVHVATEGLVFGPIDPLTVKMVLAFTIVGTFASPVEIWVTVMELLYSGKLKENFLDSLSLAIIILEDIPQAVLLLVVALCREEPSSIFQLTKAGFIILTSFIKSAPILYSCFKECGKIKTAALIGTCIEFLLGIIVFLATQVEFTETGGFHFPHPTTIVEERYNDNRYLSDVGVFIHDPNVFPASADPRDIGWLRIESLGSIKHFDRMGFRLAYQKTSNDDVILGVWKKESTSSSEPWVQNGCYAISANGRALPLTDKNCSLPSPNVTYLTFNYVPPDFFFKRYVLGDITFNANNQKSGETTKIGLQSSDFTDSVKRSHGTSKVMMHYFRYKPLDFNITDIHHMSQDDLGLRLYNVRQDDLLDVKDVWKTGWMECETTGNLAPRFDSDVPVAA